MRKPMNVRAARICITLCVAIAVLCPAALADTDGTEPRIVQQPDQLVLQLGSRWAGVEFELRTDAGVFPVPVVVNESGVLTMDLGGSTTYTLSCIGSTVPIPDPVPVVTESPTPQATPAPVPNSADQTPAARIPPVYIVLFVISILALVAILTVGYFTRKRRADDYEEWEEDEEEPLD